MRRLMKCLTKVDVGVECESAVLYIEGEGVDIEVTGADNFDWMRIVHTAIVIHVHIRDRGGRVFIHTARQEQAEEFRCVTTFLLSSNPMKRQRKIKQQQQIDRSKKYCLFSQNLKTHK